MSNPYLKTAACIADEACNLDSYKNLLPEPIKSDVAKLVEALHDLAMLLLGDDVDQVYAPEEDGVTA